MLTRMSPPGQYMNMKTRKEIKTYPEHRLDEEHTFSNSRTDSYSEWKPKPIHLPNVTITDIWPYDEENMRQEYLPMLTSVDCHSYDYDSLNNLLMKY